MSKTTLAVLIAVSTALAPAAHATLSEALTALDSGDYAAARQRLEPLARSGDSQAALNLAHIYENGWGVPASFSIAAAWYRKAGEAGLVEAQLRYGSWLEDGVGVPRDRKEAHGWFLRAAEQGNAAAKTKLGKYALYGIARKPNFVEARKWLNEAADAGDAEAQALIQALADKGHPILAVAGTARPKEAAAQRVLSEIDDLIAPMLGAGPNRWHLKLGQAPTVSPAPGGYIVTLPLVRLTGALASLRLGNIQIAFAPEGKDYAIQVRLPSRAHLVGADGQDIATITLEHHDVSGTWSTALHTMTNYQAELGGLAVQPRGLPFAMSIGEVTASRTFAQRADGRYDIAERAALEQARLESGMGSERRAVNIGTVGYVAEYQGYDLAALEAVAGAMGVDWRTGAPIDRSTSATMPQPMPPLLDAMRLSARIKDVVLEGPDGRKLGSAVGGELSLAGADLDQALSSLIVTYGHDGLGLVDQGAAWPQRGHVQARISRLPLPRLLSAGLAALGHRADGRLAHVGMSTRDEVVPSLVRPMMVALAQAHSELRITELALAGKSYDVTATGVMQPAGEGVTGALDITVSGLDAAIEAGREVAGLDFAAWRRLALARQDETGRPVDVFRVALLPSGRLTVNGSDAPPPVPAP